MKSENSRNVFEVSTKSDASNMAYASNGGLPFHTDFPSLSHPPQVSLIVISEISRDSDSGNTPCPRRNVFFS